MNEDEDDFSILEDMERIVRSIEDEQRHSKKKATQKEVVANVAKAFDIVMGSLPDFEMDSTTFYYMQYLIAYMEETYQLGRSLTTRNAGDVSDRTLASMRANIKQIMEEVRVEQEHDCLTCAGKDVCEIKKEVSWPNNQSRRVH